MNNFMKEIEMENDNFREEDNLKIQNFIQSPNKYNINKIKKKTISRKHLLNRKTDYNSFFKKTSYSRKKKFINLSKEKSKKKFKKGKFENFVLNGNNIKNIIKNNDSFEKKKKNLKNKFILKNKENVFKREIENLEERLEKKSSKNRIFSIKNYKYEINNREEIKNEIKYENFKNRAELKVHKYPIKSKYMLKNLKINLNKLNEKKKKNIQIESPKDNIFLNIKKIRNKKRNKILRLPPKNFKNKKMDVLEKSFSSKNLLLEDLKTNLFENINFENFELFSKKISKENFLFIISNFINYYQGEEDVNLMFKNLFKKKIEWFYTILIKKDNNKNDVKSFLPIGIAIWNFDLKNLRTNRVFLEKILLVNKNEDLLKNFLDLLTKKIFFENKVYVDEIYWKLSHKKVEEKFISPNREFVKNLKRNLWKWKMVLNTDRERFTVLAKINPEKKLNQKDFSFIKIFISNLITYKENIKIFNKRKIMKINFLKENITNYMFENFKESLNLKTEKKNEIDNILNSEIEMVKISNDQNLLALFQQILNKKNLKDRNLKDLCFQALEPENCKLYYFLKNIRVLPLITKNEIIYNKKIKMSRIEYQKKIKDKNIYFIDTLDSYVKIVISKCEKSFNEERFYKNMSFLILEDLNNSSEENENLDNLEKKYLWLPNFKISNNFRFSPFEKNKIFADFKEYKKFDFNFDVPLIENRIVVKPDTEDKWIKSEFLFSVFQADVENDKFVPISSFKVSRKNFVK